MRPAGCALELFPGKEGPSTSSLPPFAAYREFAPNSADASPTSLTRTGRFSDKVGFIEGGPAHDPHRVRPHVALRQGGQATTSSGAATSPPQRDSPRTCPARRPRRRPGLRHRRLHAGDGATRPTPGEVVAVDYSEGMLAAARERAGGRGLSLTLVHARAEDFIARTPVRQLRRGLAALRAGLHRLARGAPAHGPPAAPGRTRGRAHQRDHQRAPALQALRPLPQLLRAGLEAVQALRQGHRGDLAVLPPPARDLRPRPLHLRARHRGAGRAAGWPRAASSPPTPGRRRSASGSSRATPPSTGPAAPATPPIPRWTTSAPRLSGSSRTFSPPAWRPSARRRASRSTS